MTVVARRDPGAVMTVIEHLGELRRRLVICVVALAIGAVVAYVGSKAVIGVLVDFYRDATAGERDALVFTGPLDAFTTRLKIATYGGFVLAVPVFLWEMWRFVTPGLHSREKRYAVPFMCASLVLFAMGALLALYTLPRALEFLLGVGGSELEPLLTADRYLSMVSVMVVAFGLAFELPVVLTFLLLARVVTTRQLRRWRRYALVGVVAFVAVITPSQDPYSLVALAVPMYALFEGSILLGRVLGR